MTINGVIVFEGISKLDNRGPVVAIASGIAKPSTNSKTGPMVQIYILRSDVSPISAINDGLDESICGNCPLRGTVEDGINKNRACYVSVRNAPRSVYFAYKNGRYPKFDPDIHGKTLEGQQLRLAAYGDPASIPFEIWDKFLVHFESYTGYTHFWRTTDQRFRRILMASVHSSEEAKEARAMGWRYFRSMTSNEHRITGEFYCPAAAGKQFGIVTCSSCLACSGVQDRPNKANPIIAAHGGRHVEVNYQKRFIGPPIASNPANESCFT